MSDTTKGLRPLVNRAPCWESEHEPVITFFTDGGDEWGFPFFGLLAAQYTPRDQTLALQWQGAQVRIQGPRTRDFFMAFAKGSATGIKANGEDIRSVQVILPPSPLQPPREIKEESDRMSENSRKLRLSVGSEVVSACDFQGPPSKLCLSRFPAQIQQSVQMMSLFER